MSLINMNKGMMKLSLAEKLALLEEMLELEEGTLTVEQSLHDLAEWDSVAAISFMALIAEEFGKRISGDTLRGLKTVEDAVRIMEA